MSGVEDLQGGGSPEQLVPDSIPAIGVQETVPVAVGLEVEGQGPKSPVQVEMPVTQSAGGQVDEAGEDPVVQQDVGQAVIAVDQAVGFQVRAKRLQKGEIQGKDIPEEDRDYYLERRYPAFGNLVPRDVASRAAKERCDKGFGVNNTGLAVFLDFSQAIKDFGRDEIAARYGNLFDMYEEITDESPYETPMMIYPAVHYTMGGIWVDYELQTTIKGLFAIGECNFSDHGANRLGASALMQGLADGYFVLPYTIQNYLSDQITIPRFSTDLAEFVDAEKAVKDRIAKLFAIGGKRSVDSIHKELGHIMWEHVGMGRTGKGLQEGLEKLKALRQTFYKDLFIPGTAEGVNVELEKAIRLEDFILMGELIANDALHREESCGGHFREEHQTEEGEAKRDDENFFYVGCWEYQGSDDKAPVLHKEKLEYEAIKVQTRNYKN